MAPDPNSVIAYLEGRLEDAAVKELTPKNSQYAPAAKQFAKTAADTIYGGLNDLIKRLNLKPGPLATQMLQAGSCDITRVIANGENQQGESQYVIHAPRNPEGMPFYYFWGRRLGVANMIVQPIVEHLLFSPAAFSSRACAGDPTVTSSVMCYTPLFVSAPKRLQVEAYHNCVYDDLDPDGGYPCRTNTIIPGGQVIMSGSPFSQKAFFNAYSLINVSQTSSSSWLISISAAAVQLDLMDANTWFNANNNVTLTAVNPPNAKNTQRMVVTFNASARCAGGITINPQTSDPITVVNFTGAVQRTFTYAGSPGASITVASSELQSNSCAMTATVQLLDK
jgi:hypothetical protein